LLFILVYIVAAAFNVPGATVLTLTAGFLYGTIRGALYVNVAATTGATGAFLFARYVVGQGLQARYAEKLATFNTELDRNGAAYLLFVRLIPAFPFFLINLAAGLTRLRLWTFVWTTAIGILPGSLVFAYAGRQLRTIQSVGDVLSPPVYGAFLLLGTFAVLPAAVRRISLWRRGRRKEGRRLFR
jgi:uncharacterized membrane protein YdjX (TVP38/TMEM64 family)